MEKIIHYCWFGGKPLPKMAKKCIKSWKKYLPDYKIKQWNENNFDVNMNNFVKGAYEKKKWAFVSDCARTYALLNQGGIYFDTDMELKKDISFLLDKDFFIGREDSGYIAAGVIGVKEKDNKIIKQLMDRYNEFETFDENKVYEFAIPKIITNILEKYPKQVDRNGIEIYDKSVYVYPREYFYPLSYDHQKNIFTDNTCMIHYYDASWTPNSEQFINKLHRKFGTKGGDRIYNFLHFFSNIKKRVISRTKDFINRKKIWASIHFHIEKRIKKLEEKMKKIKDGDYIVIQHPYWIGVGNVGKDNFKYIIEQIEVYTEKEAKKIAEVICKENKRLVIFNGFAMGWDNIAKEIKRINKNVIIKVLWHGSHALLSEDYDWVAFNTIMDLYRAKIIDEFGLVKKSMYDFYKAKGFNVSFIMNSINIENPKKYKKERKDKEKIKIGLYSSGDRWVKNSYNQISAVALIENAVMDAIPINEKTKKMCEIFGIEYTGEEGHLKRDELLERIAGNDINLYVTFTECAPLIPLESLELGVPCITGDNHHYFENTELEKYLVVTKEDNIIEIKNKIVYALKNKDKILELYKKWKEDYVKKAKKSIEDFLLK